MIRDKLFHYHVKNQFKKMFVRFFQQTPQQRMTRIHKLYFAKRFKNSIVNILDDFLKRIKDGVVTKEEDP